MLVTPCQAVIVTALPDSARTLIESGRIAHCTTLNPDGSPQVSAVWIGLEGSGDDTEIVMGHLGDHRKVRNLRRDPRIAFSLESTEENAIGMRHNLVIYGTATITEGGAPELLRRLGHVYTGGEFRLPPDPPPGYVVRVRVDRVAGLGPWSE
jgi:PPOX class probable F420-dependent enzyme